MERLRDRDVDLYNVNGFHRFTEIGQILHNKIMIFDKIIKKSFPVKIILQIDRTHFVPYPLQHGNWPQRMGKNIKEIPWFFVKKLLWQECSSSPIPRRLLFVTWLVIFDLSKCRWTGWLWKELHVLIDNGWHFKQSLYHKLSRISSPFLKLHACLLSTVCWQKTSSWLSYFAKH